MLSRGRAVLSTVSEAKLLGLGFWISNSGFVYSKSNVFVVLFCRGLKWSGIEGLIFNLDNDIC